MAQPAPKSTGGRNIVSLVLLAAVGFGIYYYFERTGTVTIGTKDEVIYSGLSTEAQATALGNALKTDGYFKEHRCVRCCCASQSAEAHDSVVCGKGWGMEQSVDGERF